MKMRFDYTIEFLNKLETIKNAIEYRMDSILLQYKVDVDKLPETYKKEFMILNQGFNEYLEEIKKYKDGI